MLAHFSNSGCRDALQRVLPCPVFSAPDAAIDVLRERC